MNALRQLQSSNPALARDDAFQQYYGQMEGTRSESVTLQGVVNKTAILLAIAVAAGAGGYAIAPMFGWSIIAISSLVVAIIGFGICWKLCGNPQHAVILGPIYAVVEGAFLGAATFLFDKLLADMGYAATGGLALQAFVITLAVLVSMLGLYSARIIRPTKSLFAIVATLTGGIMLTYLASFALSFFGYQLPFINVFHGMGGGWSGWIGLGVNVLILGVASLWLVFDFKLIEDKISEGAPRQLEWYCGFALIVTLAWVYWEALKIAFRLAILLGNRE